MRNSDKRKAFSQWFCNKLHTTHCMSRLAQEERNMTEAFLWLE